MKKIFLFVFTLFFSLEIIAQDPLSYLRQQCPQLTEMYKEELKNCHAHYIFAVDVSLSMCKYEENVRPALEAFVRALPNGDRITIIPFAHDALDNKMGFDVTIDNQTRSSLIQMLTTLYPQGQEKKDRQYYDTDIYVAQKAVARSVQRNSQYDVNIILFISDLLHCPKDNIDRQFSDAEMGDMLTLMKAAKSDAENLVFSLELPQSGKPIGYVYPQLKSLYEEWGVKLEQQKVPNNSESLIRQWFDQQKDRIMFTKLQTIILKENKANPIEVRTEMDVDGNVIANIKWKADKLYPRLTLDSTYILDSKFYFDVNEDYVNYSAVGEFNEEIELGRVKHNNYGFHKLADTLHFDVKLPVPYQTEIDKLLEGRPTPLANATEYQTRWVWTFFLPLWFTIVLAVLFILYVLGVIKAMIRNSKNRLDGAEVKITDKVTDEVKSKKIKGKSFVEANESWGFKIYHVPSSPVWVFKKPYFRWEKTKGSVIAG